LAVHSSGAQHFSRAGGAVSSPIDFGVGAPTWFSGEVALSQRGKYAVTVAGASALAADVYAIASDGSAVQVTSSPAAISRAGYLPEELDGPFLAISDDGQQCAWRTEGLAREAFLGRVPWQAPANSTQLTADALFIDTIDEVGQFAFRSDSLLRFTAGERDTAAGGIDQIDVFAAQLAPGAATAVLSNQTLSSGIASPPYLAPGRLKPEGAIDVPGAKGRLFADDDREELLLLAPLFGAPQVLLTQVKSFEASARSGEHWLLALRRTGGSQPRQVLHWDANAPLVLQLLYSDDNTDELTRLSLRGNTGAFVDSQVSGEHLWAVDLGGGGLQLFSPRSFLYRSGPAISASGEVVCGLGNPALQTVFARWQPGTPPKRLGPTAGPGFVLRGL
jgi:hypothetical protein